jgi:hypothetical protein
VLAVSAGRRILVLDAEIIAWSGPHPDFGALQRRMTVGRPGCSPRCPSPSSCAMCGDLAATASPAAVCAALWWTISACRSPGAVRVLPAFAGDAAASCAGNRVWLIR